MTLLLKDPQAVLDYMIDWGAEYLCDGDQLALSEWSVVPDEDDGVTVIDSFFDATTATAKAGGGKAGGVYRLVNRVLTVAGRADDRSIVLRVETR